MTKRRRRRRSRSRDVTPGQGLELVLGPSGTCRCPPSIGEAGCRDEFECLSEFDSEEERERAYWSRRDLIMGNREASRPGTRPWSWWRYEARAHCDHDPRCPAPRLLDRAGQLEWLDRHGVLGVRERAELAKRRDLRHSMEEETT